MNIDYSMPRIFVSLYESPNDPFQSKYGQNSLQRKQFSAQYTNRWQRYSNVSIISYNL